MQYNSLTHTTFQPASADILQQKPGEVQQKYENLSRGGVMEAKKKHTVIVTLKLWEES